MQILQTILDTLKDGESVSLNGLSAQLQISPAALLAAMEQLERMGRIRRIAPSPFHCPHSCKGCGGDCQGGQAPRLSGQNMYWRLT